MRIKVRHTGVHPMRRLYALLAVSAAKIALCAIVPTPAARAQSFPNKPIRLIVPWSSGGSTDALGRTLGVDMAAKSPADGYTLTVIELPHA